MLLIDGKIYESQELPTIYFGSHRPLSYVLNPKAACTLSLHFLFYLNHNYRYFDISYIHFSRSALFRLRGPELDPRVLQAFYRLSPERFSFVRDPLRRFVSAFYEKVFLGGDADYMELRDMLTSVHNIDLSPEADPAKSCLAFAKWISSHQDQRLIERHFRPQCLNLMVGSRFSVDTIIRLEDREAVSAFFTKWIGSEKAAWFLSLQFNVQKYSLNDFVTDELQDLIRTIYADDYRYFYTNNEDAGRLGSNGAVSAFQ
jgi:Sulfotransferase family